MNQFTYHYGQNVTKEVIIDVLKANGYTIKNDKVQINDLPWYIDLPINLNALPKFLDNHKPMPYFGQNS